MAWRPHGRANADPSNPSAWGVCDRCGFWYLLRDLQWQYEWAGAQLTNLRVLVCDTDLDIPQEQLRTIILPPDPLPVFNARPESFQIDETSYLVTDSLLPLITQAGANFVLEDGA